MLPFLLHSVTSGALTWQRILLFEFDELLRITLYIYYCLNLYSMYIYIYVYTLYICIPHICLQVDVVMKGLLPPFNSNLLNPQGLILLIQMAP